MNIHYENSTQVSLSLSLHFSSRNPNMMTEKKNKYSKETFDPKEKLETNPLTHQEAFFPNKNNPNCLVFGDLPIIYSLHFF